MTTKTEIRMGLIKRIDQLGHRYKRNSKGGEVGVEKKWREGILKPEVIDEIERRTMILRHAVQAQPAMLTPTKKATEEDKAVQIESGHLERALLGKRAAIMADLRGMPAEFLRFYPPLVEIEYDLARVRRLAHPEAANLVIAIAQWVVPIVRAAAAPDGLGDDGLVVQLVAEMIDIAAEDLNSWPGANPEAIGRILRNARHLVLMKAPPAAASNLVATVTETEGGQRITTYSGNGSFIADMQPPVRVVRLTSPADLRRDRG
jgi:hypothetical protein